MGRESTDASSCVRRTTSLGSLMKFEQHTHPVYTDCLASELPGAPKCYIAI
jgi:hypothetical protein